MSNIQHLFSQIKNGINAKIKIIKIESSITRSKLCINILTLLEKEGYLESINYSTNYKSKFLNKSKNLLIKLKYNVNGQSVISSLIPISKPGHKVYINIKTLWQIKSGYGTYIISTSKGLMTDSDARLLNLGGELLFIII